MYNDNRLSLRQQGFTLVELMVSLIIFIFIMLGLLKVEISALSAQSRNQYRDEALRLAEDELTRLKGEPYTELNPIAWSEPDCSGPSVSCPKVKMRSGNVTFARTAQIADITVQDAAGETMVEMKKIDIAVGWNQGNSSTTITPTNRNNQATLSTVIVQP